MRIYNGDIKKVGFLPPNAIITNFTNNFTSSIEVAQRYNFF